MPILPVIDLLILLAWTTLAAGGALKIVNLALAQSWTLIGFAPFDLLMIAAVLLVFALTLIGRTWVKTHEPAVLAAQRAEAAREAYHGLRQDRRREDAPAAPVAAPAPAGWQTRSLDG